jgi:REP element-mobilizing transposase RayT
VDDARNRTCLRVDNYFMSNSANGHAQDTHTTIKKRHGAYLPHWTRDGAWYAVTFRLWDSLPRHVIESWLFERKSIVKTAQQMKRPLSEHEERRLAHLYSERVERYLDAGYGACFMNDERIAELVQNALFHFDGVRYSLAAWCVMPNHVHVVVQPFAGRENTGGTPVPLAELSDILHSWKSFTAKEANKLLRRSGDFWQAESYDHLIRNEADFRHAVHYVLNNPIQAGLKNWKWVGLTEYGRRILCFE